MKKKKKKKISSALFLILSNRLKMLCNEGRRQAERARRERDRTRRRLINMSFSPIEFQSLIWRESRADLLHPLFDTFHSQHVILPDQQSPALLTCEATVETNPRRSSPDALEFVDVQSELSDELPADADRTRRNPSEIYLRMCEEKRVRPLNEVIEGLKGKNFNLSEMSISDLDLQVICLAARVDRTFRLFNWSASNLVFLLSFELLITGSWKNSITSFEWQSDHWSRLCLRWRSLSRQLHLGRARALSNERLGTFCSSGHFAKSYSNRRFTNSFRAVRQRSDADDKKAQHLV